MGEKQATITQGAVPEGLGEAASEGRSGGAEDRGEPGP